MNKTTPRDPLCRRRRSRARIRFRRSRCRRTRHLRRRLTSAYPAPAHRASFEFNAFGHLVFFQTVDVLLETMRNLGKEAFARGCRAAGRLRAVANFAATPLHEDHRDGALKSAARTETCPPERVRDTPSSEPKLAARPGRGLSAFLRTLRNVKERQARSRTQTSVGSNLAHPRAGTKTQRNVPRSHSCLYYPRFIFSLSVGDTRRRVQPCTLVDSDDDGCDDDSGDDGDDDGGDCDW